MNRRFLSPVSLLTVFAMIVAACSSDDAYETTKPQPRLPQMWPSALDVSVEASQFSTVIAAIEAADLGEILEGAGPFTVLRPNRYRCREFCAALLPGS